MKSFIPYEHRGKMYRELVICNKCDVDKIVHMFNEESNVWLKKLLAVKLYEVVDIYDLNEYELDIYEAILCQIK